MRTKRLVEGLDNSQKIRFIVNGFMMHCRIKDILNISERHQRMAVWNALNRIGLENIVAKQQNKPGITGFGSNSDGIDVQVDLCDAQTIIY